MHGAFIRNVKFFFFTVFKDYFYVAQKLQFYLSMAVFVERGGSSHFIPCYLLAFQHSGLVNQPKAL